MQLAYRNCPNSNHSLARQSPISNGKSTEWSTIQGVIERLISNWPRARSARLDLKCTLVLKVSIVHSGDVWRVLCIGNHMISSAICYKLARVNF